MTLFIAALLIYHFDMAWWWYAIAVTIWGGQFVVAHLLANA